MESICFRLSCMTAYSRLPDFKSMLNQMLVLRMHPTGFFFLSETKENTNKHTKVPRGWVGWEAAAVICPILMGPLRLPTAVGPGRRRKFGCTSLLVRGAPKERCVGAKRRTGNQVTR